MFVQGKKYGLLWDGFNKRVDDVRHFDEKEYRRHVYTKQHFGSQAMVTAAALHSSGAAWKPNAFGLASAGGGGGTRVI